MDIFSTTVDESSLERLAYRFSYSSQILGIIAEGFVCIVTYTILLVIICKRRTFNVLPLRVKLSLGFQAVYAPYYTTLLILCIRSTKQMGIFNWS